LNVVTAPIDVSLVLVKASFPDLLVFFDGGIDQFQYLQFTDKIDLVCIIGRLVVVAMNACKEK
jgi:hypothetical protein